MKNNRIRVLIFTEGGSQIGQGHISRCSSLYDELDHQGIESELIIHGDAVDKGIINDRKHKMVNWLSPSFLNATIKPNDYGIVDSYLADEKIYHVIADRAKKCLFIDDYGRIHYPKGIVVNPSLYTKTVTYPNQAMTSYLLGSDFIILRKAFMNIDRDPPLPKVTNVLITMGGADPQNLTPAIMSKLCPHYPDITFHVIIGPSFRNRAEINTCLDSNIKLYEHVASEEMKWIMLKCDLAITAAGQTIYELIATQTPFIPIKVADNQFNHALGLVELQLVDEVLNHNDPLLLEKMEEKFKRLLAVSKRNELTAKYKNQIDGLGGKRMISALLQEEEQRRPYFLRMVHKDDVEEIFHLSNEDYVRQYSINPHKINWNDHIQWFENMMKSENHVFFVITDATNQFYGQIRYLIEEFSATVSISLGKKLLGKGLSYPLLLESIEMMTKQRHGLKEIIAFVSDQNAASKRLFQKAGFTFAEQNNGLLKFVYSLNKGVG
ncbi:bifunctional UDP-2,4-diacetamido-2,4,6-trideoxy-beta-L-altropyranose hydrolase/GNAT family N-acetyltransferase [Bacillus sp. JJ1764]|uniref:bifunctional UDP-2,4-diacetamido-2,4,6-trideoxy-beta-L-altropyranose hydrolase/GNAT family N-acetyltransferase n=1 Tax=Bacillus sp. JJ1764 TaxID=3122964 RepID=UPI002FFE4104